MKRTLRRSAKMRRREEETGNSLRLGLEDNGNGRKTHRHGLISTACLCLTITALSLLASRALEGVCFCLLFCSREGLEKVFFFNSAISSLPFFGCHFLQQIGVVSERMKRLHTSFVIFVSFSTGRFPLTTVSRRPGLFLSLRLTNNERIFCLYVAFVPPLSLKTHFSTPRARDRISSTASGCSE